MERLPAAKLLRLVSIKCYPLAFDVGVNAVADGDAGTSEDAHAISVNGQPYGLPPK